MPIFALVNERYKNMERLKQILQFIIEILTLITHLLKNK